MWTPQPLLYPPPPNTPEAKPYLFVSFFPTDEASPASDLAARLANSPWPRSSSLPRCLQQTAPVAWPSASPPRSSCPCSPGRMSLSPRLEVPSTMEEEEDIPTREEERRMRRGLVRQRKAMRYYQRMPSRPKARKGGVPVPMAARSTATPSIEAPGLPSTTVVGVASNGGGGGHSINWDELLFPLRESMVGSDEVLPSIDEPVPCGQELLMVCGKPVQNIEELFVYVEPDVNEVMPDCLCSPRREMRIWTSKKWV